MREIGSEFWEVETGGSRCLVFPESVQWYLSGRSALQAIIRELSWAKSVSIPAWFCDSMVKPFFDAGIEVSYYPVYADNGLIQEVCADSDILFVMDYFGYMSERKFNHPCIIRDVTHSIFSAEHSDADYYFGSLRKWSGIWTGGYAWTRDGHNLSMENADDKGYVYARSKAMQLKECYIKHKLDENRDFITDKRYLDIYKDAEEYLESVGIVAGAVRDIELVKNLDVEYIRKQRRENARILMDAFPELLIFPQCKETDCPMFVPILVPGGKRDELRKYLIAKDIYCPIHWPISKYHVLDAKTRVLYDGELSLVCDQRYTRKDMFRMVETIRSFFEER